MEVAHPVHGVQHAAAAGRLFNPGHSIEVAWFVLRLCRLSPDPDLEGMALAALEGSLELGWDAAHGGGLVYMLDVLGKPLADCTVTAEHKLWWPHTEALIACTLALEHTGDTKWLEWLRKVHIYVYTHFYDGGKAGGKAEGKAGGSDEIIQVGQDGVCRARAGGGGDGGDGGGGGGGEWFGYLRRDGSVFNECKGGNYKGFFHVPRGLLMSMRTAERYLAKTAQ